MSVSFKLCRIPAILTFVFAASCVSNDERAAPWAPAAALDCSNLVATGDGPIRGHNSRSGQSCEYLGIRYAAAPVENLRFANPRPAPKHARTFVALEPASSCLQKIHLDMFGFDATVSTSGVEDCLFLNIWSPGGENLPVMVYIHGGGFVFGSGASDRYNGDLLAQEKVIVVTINYRLGPLGFFYYPSLITEGGSAGNQGILDQIQALAWVRQNIGNFGGDASNVTIFGESAGGMSVCTLVASPMAKGLFHAAIMESGGCAVVAEPATGFARAVSYAAETGCAGAADPLACMRAVPAAELIEKMRFGLLSGAIEPHVDGHVLLGTPLDVIRSGNFNRVPFMAGSNANEVQALALADPHYLALQHMRWGTYYQALEATFGPADGARLAWLYGYEQYKTPFDSWFMLKSDTILGCPALIAAQAVASQATPAYHFVFTWKDLGAVSRVTGTFHGLDLNFVFGNLGLLSTVIPSDKWSATLALSAEMRRTWATFARTHVPASAATPPWPAVDQGSMILDYEFAVDANIKREACAFWESRLPVGLENQTARLNNLILP